jgi:hypothetical protein
MSGLTVEQVNEMQDEMNRIDDTGNKVDDAAAQAGAKADAGADSKVDDKKVDDDKAKDADDIDVIRELKEQIRASNEALQKVTGDYQKLQKIMVDKGIITDVEVAATKATEDAAKAAFLARQDKLNEMVSIMEVNPAYADVREVCSQGNLDDLIEAFSRFYVKENGGSLSEVAVAMEKEIWSEANPYKRIYELVKKYHPKYATANETAEQKRAREAADAAKKLAEEADKGKGKDTVQKSAADMGTGGTGGTGGAGWTAAKIDAMPEDELHTVPKDIYDKYLRGLLT